MNKKTYQQLSKDELYAIAKLRQDVFIVEQNSVYVDLDQLDQDAYHYLLKDQQKKLFGYARYRVLAADNKVKVERFVLDKQNRGMGQGKQLLQTMIKDIKTELPEMKITLSAQVYVCEFYRQFGFREFGKAYDDGGIEHIDMQYQM
ncbi:GNAT family N-acetyltransferase [Paraglaciecola sp. L3A3]|uniref:GNAT family N-acetyltransferase n=1 Tax=Paraglaciecola sp. L3A3 TaxID=2686358 RepID=UPI00131A89DE|nr:GNAT family N-acetyltransferase [Paraglaciecola sp. L3A3]